MSPKVLNAEKLERKFASLTKSRESIQNLSMWIIRHKEFHKEIVDQWFDALTRDLNALTMFYVANDVIQNCGRKKAPEFREAFSTVLEKAVSLDKVKEIKTEVIRMITLWHERAIYDEIFYNKLQDKLNSVEEPEINIDEELADVDVIAKYKLDNLINSLKKLKALEDELFEKESFLEDIEEPAITNLDNIIVKMDSQRELQKIDKFTKLVEDYLSLSDKVMTAKKTALLNLKYSNIFYNAQYEDAKKVAHAYRIYGKKVKIMDKSLSEKLAILQEQSPFSVDTPDIESNSSQQSGSPSPMITEKSKNCLENSSEAYLSPKSVDIELTCSTPLKYKSPVDEIQWSPSDTCDSTKSLSVDERTAKLVDTLKCDDDKDENESKELITKDLSKNAVCEDGLSVVDNAEKNVADFKEAFNSLAENLGKNSDVPEMKENLSDSKTEKSNSNKASGSELQILPDPDSIDFLLEKAYDDKKVKSKLSFKRKIDNLLKLKQSKTCKLSNDEDKIDSEDKDPPQSSGNQMEKTPGLAINETESTENLEKTEKVMITEEKVDSKHIKDSKQIIMPNADQIENVKTEQTKETTQIAPEESNSDAPKAVSSSTAITFQTLPDIPTELLKNILDINRINMNMSLNSETGFSDNVAKSSIESDEQLNSSVTDIGDNSKADHQVVSTTVTCSASLKSEKKDAENMPDEAAISDTKCADPSVSSAENNTKEPSKFLKNLHNVLNCFTRKEAGFAELKSSKTLNSLPSIPLENTLNIYSCIMQCYNDAGSKSSPSSDISSTNANNITGSQTKDAMNNERFHSLNNVQNVNFQQNSYFLNKESSYVNNNESRYNDLSSKSDNLEIMDMEVDSDDEDTK